MKVRERFPFGKDGGLPTRREYSSYKAEQKAREKKYGGSFLVHGRKHPKKNHREKKSTNAIRGGKRIERIAEAHPYRARRGTSKKGTYWGLLNAQDRNRLDPEGEKRPIEREKKIFSSEEIHERTLPWYREVKGLS